jgi:hypothetical protein
MDTLPGMIIIAATPAGQHAIDRRGAIKLPAALRRLCGVNYGPPVVLAAALPEQVMVIHPSATISALLAAHYTDLIKSNLCLTQLGHHPLSFRPQQLPLRIGRIRRVTGDTVTTPTARRGATGIRESNRVNRHSRALGGAGRLGTFLLPRARPHTTATRRTMIHPHTPPRPSPTGYTLCQQALRPLELRRAA